MIRVDKGIITVNAGTLRLKSENSISASNHTVTVVREKNRMVKIYVDNSLDCSGYEERGKAVLSCELTSDAEGFKVINSATPYSDIVELGGVLKKSRKRHRK